MMRSRHSALITRVTSSFPNFPPRPSACFSNELSSNSKLATRCGWRLAMLEEGVDVDERVQRALFARTLFGEPKMSHVVQHVATVIQDMHFEQGTVIYRQGGSSAHIYFILEGQVALEAPGELTWTFGMRDGFGFLDAMRDRPHTRNAVALTDVHLLALAIEDWLDLLEDHGEL